LNVFMEIAYDKIERLCMNLNLMTD
jgi:hypothetical protein